MNQVNVALLGFGNVGRAFARYIHANAETQPIEIKIRAVADSSGALFLDEAYSLERVLAHKQSGAALSEFTTAPLAQRTPVVTVDKGPVVHGLNELIEIAGKSGARLGFSGTTGVTIPDEICDDRVLEIRGVLNGTTNYILTEMQQHQRSFKHALMTAQVEGIAEPDPSLDIEGWDTASKILILAKSLMRATARLDAVSRIGIGPQTESLIRIAKDTGRVVRLVGRSRVWQGRVRVSVAPKLIDPDSPFYEVEGTSKAAVFRTEARGQILSLARSGRDAISQTILDDIIRVSSRDCDSSH